MYSLPTSATLAAFTMAVGGFHRSNEPHGFDHSQRFLRHRGRPSGRGNCSTHGRARIA